MIEARRTDIRYYKTPRPEMLAFLPARRARVLEIGCGQGIFAAGLEGVQEAWGIEPTDAAGMARKCLHKVLQATFDQAKTELPKGYFDLVICNDVIEHMPDHDDFFDKIKNYMAPGGVIIGSIPNVRYFANLFDVLVGRDWAYRDAGILDRTHLRFFTERSLRRTFAKHGYKIEAFQGINGGINWSDPLILTRHKLFGTVSLLLSAGYFADIRHPQFAFRIAPVDRPFRPPTQAPDGRTSSGAGRPRGAA